VYEMGEGVMAEVVVVGSINMDVVMSVPHFPAPGETLEGISLNHYPGGKGANQAVALSRMGKSVAMVAHVGGDGYGVQLRAGLEGNNVDTTSVGVREETSSGLAFITVDAHGENSIVLIPGANAAVSKADVDAHEELLKNTHALVVQFEIPMETIVHALELAKRHGKLTIVNPAPARPLPEAKAAIEKADILVVNETEAALLSGLMVEGVAECEQAGRSLMQLGPRAVIITLGAQGAVLIDAEQVTHVPAPAVNVVDTTAAGDAFIGALTAGLIDGLSLTAAVELANCAGALAVTKPGAQPSLPTRKDVHAFQAQH